MKPAGKIDPKSREVETRRIGLQDRLKEQVKDAKHDGGKSQRRSLADRNKATGQTK